MMMVLRVDDITMVMKLVRADKVGGVNDGCYT
jgi:hypothetical protein